MACVVYVTPQIYFSVFPLRWLSCLSLLWISFFVPTSFSKSLTSPFPDCIHDIDHSLLSCNEGANSLWRKWLANLLPEMCALWMPQCLLNAKGRSRSQVLLSQVLWCFSGQMLLHERSHNHEHYSQQFLQSYPIAGFIVRWNLIITLCHQPKQKRQHFLLL